MGNRKTSELVAATALTGAEEIPVTQGSASRSATVQQINDLVLPVAMSGLSPRSHPTPPFATVITDFSSGWFHGGTAVSSNLSDTDSEVGRHSSVVTATSGTNTFSIYNQAAVDMTNRHFVVLVKMDDFSKIGGLTLRVSDDVNVATRFNDLRVTGGNSVNSIYSVGDSWVPVTFSWADSSATGSVNRASIKSYQFRAISFGGASTTVRFKRLGAVTRASAVGIISFDDNWKSAEMALPKLDRLGFAPTMYTIVGLIGTPGYMSLDDLIRWETLHGGEVAGHCFSTSIHDAANGYRSLSVEECDADMRQLKGFLLGDNDRSHGFRGADNFSWPKGQFDRDREAVARRYFATMTMATPPFIAQAWPTATPERIARYPVTATTTPAQIQAEAAKAVANGTGVEFMFHQIKSSGASGETEYNLADFESAMDLIAATGLPIRTKSQVVLSSYA